MKKALLFAGILFLFFSCQKEKTISRPIISDNQKKIIQWYNTVNNSSAKATQKIALETASIERAALREPNEYKAMVAFVLAIQSSNNTSYQLGLKYYEKALQLLKKSSADTLKAKIHNGMGSNYMNTGDYSKSLMHLYLSLKIYEKHQDRKGICSVNACIGEVYFQKGNFLSAKESIKTGLLALKSNKANSVYLSAAHGLANVYGINGEYEKALAIDEEGIWISDSMQVPKLKVAFLDNKANCYMYSKRLDSAEYYFNECLAIDRAVGNQKQIADSYSNLAELYSFKKDFKKAERHALQSITILKSINCKPNLGKSYTILVAIYTAQKKFEKAAAIQKLLYENYKSMMDEKNVAAIAEYKILYETEKKETRIQLLENENKIRKLAIKQQQLKIDRKNQMLLICLLVLLFFFIVGYFWKNQQKLKNKLLYEKIIRDTEEQERNRIAKDIHDDLGSGLSKINFLSELIFQKTAHLPDIKSHCESVKETAGKMIENMRDLIWTLNTDNITLANLVSRMREYTTDYLEDYPIAIKYVLPSQLPQSAIIKESHRELFMVVKETLNNTSKYAAATELLFKVVLTTQTFQLIIQDNGIGFDSVRHANGNGLRNMQTRLQQLGGDCVVTSQIGKGTTIHVTLPLEKMLKEMPINSSAENELLLL